jgi:LuxR family maltose regulon positive regulatory protein
VSPEARFVRSFAELWQIYALQQSGKPQEALRLMHGKLAGQPQRPDVRTNRLMLAQCVVYLSEADIYGLRSAAKAYLDLAALTRHRISEGWANFGLGWSYYQENDLDRAAFYFQKAVAARQQIHTRAAIDSLIGLAFIHHAQDDADQVQETLTMLQSFIVEQGVVGLLNLPESLALQFTQSIDPQRDVSHLKTLLREQMAADNWELPVLTACRMEILGGGPGLLEAEKTLHECESFALSRNNKKHLMRIGALKALLSETRGEKEQAKRLLEQAVLLGQPGGAVRTFADIAAELQPCFERLAAKGVAPDYVQKILIAFTVNEQDLPASSLQAVNQEAAALIADLTNREMEVLLLLGERLTNKEISARLFISPDTVKKHTIKIYAKLEVKNRRQAVSRARALGLINY